jgi:hypothetical protein
MFSADLLNQFFGGGLYAIVAKGRPIPGRTGKQSQSLAGLEDHSGSAAEGRNTMSTLPGTPLGQNGLARQG